MGVGDVGPGIGSDGRGVGSVGPGLGSVGGTGIGAGWIGSALWSWWLDTDENTVW